MKDFRFIILFPKTVPKVYDKHNLKRC